MSGTPLGEEHAEPVSESGSYAASFAGILGRAVGLTLTGNVVGRVLGFAGNVLTARIIGTAGFGLLGMVRSTLSLGASFADPGIGATSSRYVPRLRGSDPESLSELLGLVSLVGVLGSLLAGAALLWLAPLLADEVYATSGLRPLLVAAVPWMVASVVAKLAEKVLRGFERFGALAATRSLRGVLVLGTLAAVLILWRDTPLGAVLAFGAVEVTIAGVLVAVAWTEGLRHAARPVRWPTLRVVKEPFRQFAIPSYAFVLLQAPVSWFLLTRLARLDQGSEFVGAVQATGSFRSALGLIPAALATTLLPVLSRLHGLATDESFARKVRRLVRLLWFFAVPTGALAAAALPFFLDAVFGEEFGHFAVPCAVLLLVTAWSIVNEAFDRTLAAVGRMWLSFALGAGYAVAAVTLTLALVPRYELWGFVIAQFAAMAGYVIVQQELVGRWIRYGTSDRWTAAITALVSGAAAVVIAGVATGWQTLVAAMALGAGLAAGGWRLLLGPGERDFIWTRARAALWKVRSTTNV